MASNANAKIRRVQRSGFIWFLVFCAGRVVIVRALAIRCNAMAMKYSDEQVRAQLRELAAESSQRELARILGVQPSVICETINGTRDPSPALLRGLGLRRVVHYVKEPA